MDRLTLTVADRVYAGWTRIRVERGIEQAAGGFELAVTERWAGQDVVRPIRPGMPCAVTIDGATVVTGYVDDVDVDYGGTSHGVTVRGRDATGDLVDCAAIHESGAWAGRTLDQIATDLARPFGVGVRVETDVGAAFAEYQVQEGESVFECLERAARMRGVLLTSDGLGHLVLTRAGSGRMGTALVLGENVLAASGGFSMRDRHSEYRVKGSMPGSDFTAPEQHAEPAAAALDAGVPRYRPLVVVAEENGDTGTLAARAVWERNVRYGRAVRIGYTVTGWRAGGELWAPNRRVRVRDAFLGVDEELLIAAVTFTLDEQGGEIAQVSVTRPEAFDVEPLAVSAGAGDLLL